MSEVVASAIAAKAGLEPGSVLVAEDSAEYLRLDVMTPEGKIRRRSFKKSDERWLDRAIVEAAKVGSDD